MPNLMLTTSCNINCPYCFAQEKINRNKRSKEISFENVITVMNIFKDWKIDEIRLLGGEPVLHSRFKEIINLIQDRGFLIHIFTNGIFDRETADFLAKKKNISYLVNYNNESFYNNKKIVLDVRALEKIDYFFRECGKHISIGVNIYGTNFQGDYLIKKIKEYKLNKSIRIAFANPIGGKFDGYVENKYLKLNDYKFLIPKIVELSRKCNKENILFSFDCCLPLCSFKKEDLEELYNNVREYPTTVCRPVIDIGIDLRVWRCFATSRMFNTKKITDFSSLAEIYQYFEKKFSRFRMIGGLDACFRCENLKKRICQGGCLGHTINSFCH